MADDDGGLSAVESLLGNRYTREARLAPAFLSVFPILLLLLSLFPELRTIVPALLALFCVFGVVRWISHIARGIGDRKEIKLFHRWCGKPTTTMLRFAAKRPDNPCTPRNAQILHLLNEAPPATNIEHLITKRGGPEFPDEAVDEAAVKIHNRDARADKLDSLYEPVVAWMRENSRENQLVFEEEISYGFQRNFFALKRFALGCGVVSFYVEAKWVHLWWQKSWPYHTPIANPIDTAVLIAIFAYLVGVLLFVSENSVKVQGFIYARQLLNSFYGTASSDQPADGKGGHGKPS